MKPTIPGQPLPPLPPPLDLWFEILRQDMARIRTCMSDDSSHQIASLNFRHAISHMRLGWMMVTDHKSRSSVTFQDASKETSGLSDLAKEHPTSPADEIFQRDWAESRETQKRHEKENLPWWEKDDRFAQFTIMAKEDILRACKIQGIPLRREASLPAFLRATILACKDTLIYPRLKNPLGWEKFKIADKLFAKSICIVIKANHDCLDTSLQCNLSHLLGWLQHKLGLSSSTASR
jgi:hypothetical protein